MVPYTYIHTVSIPSVKAFTESTSLKSDPPLTLPGFSYRTAICAVAVVCSLKPVMLARELYIILFSRDLALKSSNLETLIV